MTSSPLKCGFIAAVFALLQVSLTAAVIAAEDRRAANESLFARDNLIAWCIVPFDDRKRSPSDRAEMLARLGFKKFAYDYWAEHIPTFDDEVKALQAHSIELTAWWFPQTLNAEAKKILSVLERHGVKTQLWVTGSGEPTANADEQRTPVEKEATRIRTIADAAAKIGCSVGLYNHGGWFGEPENQIDIIRELQLPNVGIVYNLHHGHDHLPRFAELLQKMRPYLYALNLNGMLADGERAGVKILPLGEGEHDLTLLKTIKDSGYTGPIGILNHTQENAEFRLQDNLDGLDWLVKQLNGSPPGPKPALRTWVRSAVKQSPAKSKQASATTTPAHSHAAHAAIESANPPAAGPIAYGAAVASEISSKARQHGDALRGVELFTSAKLACINCHKIGPHGGQIGPELIAAAAKQTNEALTESVLWPKRTVAPEYVALTVSTAEGQTHQGYKAAETSELLTLRIPATGVTVTIPKSQIEARQDLGTLMPDDLVAALTEQQRFDLIRFLTELRTADASLIESVGRFMKLAHVHEPRQFEFDRAPLNPDHWPNWQHKINRERIYDFYAKEADYFRRQPITGGFLPQYPGLDGGTLGHWGNQEEEDWADDRWNQTILGSVQSGVFHGKSITVPRAVCMRLGDDGQLAACFDPDTLTYAAAWRVEGDRYLRFSDVRHGFMHGISPNGRALSIELANKRSNASEYHGYYRHGERIVFAYRIGDTEYLDAPWVNERGEFERDIRPANEHPLKHAIDGGPRQWMWDFQAAGQLGQQVPFAVDTIPLPFENPWKALIFCGGHAFLSDGSALVCTIQGDVWHVAGLDADLKQVRWKRFAAGLNHALGIVVDNDGIFVLGRDQITRLHDLNSDGEADFHECFSRAYATSPAGHDFICGLERDAQGRFYTASGNQGLMRVSPDGKQAELLATGFRNPDGLGLSSDGLITVPCSEGDWTPASMICALPRNSSPGANPNAPGSITHFGYRGPKDGQPPQVPLVYLPRGLDNSSGGQVAITGPAWKSLAGNMVHFSYGAGTSYLLLTDAVNGQYQGAVVPMNTDFRAGPHRGRFHPIEGQLYVTGMGGWGTYTPEDGCFQRVRLSFESNRTADQTTGRINLPRGFHVHENGIRVSFTSPLDRHSAVEQTANHFAQCWNYRYSSAYGSPELTPSHFGTPGHDQLRITSAQLIGERDLFLEIPDLQPVNQLHLSIGLEADSSRNDSYSGRCELFLTVNALDAPFTGIQGYQPRRKIIAAHPMLTDMALALKTVPNPWQKRNKMARGITIETAGNLSFATRSFQVRPGEPIALTLKNPDVVPHNWALVKPGALQRVGEASNRLIADPEAAARQYIPETDDVLVYTDIVAPGGEFIVYFRAPTEPGRYPYLCTFPGHWMVMNGEMRVVDE